MKRILRRGVTLCIAALSVFFALSIAQVLVFRFLNPPFTVWMAWEWLSTSIHRELDEHPYELRKLRWRTLDQISPHLIGAVLAAEDQRFLSHHGFDLVEMEEALRGMFSSGKVRGASTISMQTARSVFLWPSRTWLRKLSEAYYTLLIEMIWSKKRTMEVYLNTVDWGEGIVGVDSASLRYFSRSAKELGPSDAAMLAAILPNPRVWSPFHPTSTLKERQKRILKEMEKMPVSQILR